MGINHDVVKHPSHYTEGRKFEPKDVIRDWGLNFNLGSAVKYVARAGRKDDIVQDLKKAQEFIQFEIDAIEEARATATKPQEEIDVSELFERMKHTPVKVMVCNPHDDVIDVVALAVEKMRISEDDGK